MASPPAGATGPGMAAGSVPSTPAGTTPRRKAAITRSLRNRGVRIIQASTPRSAKGSAREWITGEGGATRVGSGPPDYLEEDIRGAGIPGLGEPVDRGLA